MSGLNIESCMTDRESLEASEVEECQQLLAKKEAALANELNPLLEDKIIDLLAKDPVDMQSIVNILINITVFSDKLDLAELKRLLELLDEYMDSNTLESYDKGLVETAKKKIEKEVINTIRSLHDEVNAALLLKKFIFSTLETSDSKYLDHIDSLIDFFSSDVENLLNNALNTPLSNDVSEDLIKILEKYLEGSSDNNEERKTEAKRILDKVKALYYGIL